MKTQSVFRRVRGWLALAVLWGSAAAAPAQAPVWPQDQGDLAPDPAARWGRLPNGVRHVWLPNREPPGRVSLRLLVESGSLQEREEQRGLAHFLEHMAFNGTRHFAAAEMVEYFQRLGMGFGADTNAHTSFDETVYQLELPRTDEALLADAFRLLRDYADGMLLEPAQIERERGVILAEKRQRDSVEFRAFQAEFSFLMPEALLPRRMPIGEEEVIARAPREVFQEFYARAYRPERLVVVGVGELPPERWEALLREHFGDVAAPTVPFDEPPAGSIRPRGLEAMIHRDPEASATQVSLQTVQAIGPRPDSAARRRRELHRDAAHAILSRRLEILSREEDAPFQRGVAYSGDWFDFARNSGLELTCRPDQWRAALQLAETELRRALQHGFTEAEVAEIRAKLENAYREAVRQAPTRKSADLADSLVSTVSGGRVFTHPEAELAQALADLADLTPATAREALREVWPEGERLVVVSGNLAAADPDPAAVYRALAESLLRPVAPPAVAAAADFAYTDFGPAGSIVRRTPLPDLGAEQVEFANGLLLQHKRTDFEAGVIRLGLRFGRGLLDAPADQPGLAQLAQRTFLAGGLGAHSADDLERLLAGRSVDLDFSVEDDAFVLRGVTAPPDLRRQLEFLCAYLTDPGYRPESLRQVRESVERLYRQLRHTPGGVMQNEVARFLGGGDFRFGHPTEEELRARTLEEVRAWLTPALGRAQLTLSVVGDFDPAALEEAVAATCGALPPRDPAPDSRATRREVAFPRGAADRIFPCVTEIPKAVVAVYWPTEDLWDIARTRRLSLLAEALGDRLRVKVREELGEAYSPSAAHFASDTYRGYGYLQALLVVAPEQAGPVADLVRQIGAEMAAGGVTEDETERARRPQLTALEEWMRNNQYWLENVLLTAREYPQRLTWPLSLKSDFEAVTAAELSALAARYLAPSAAVRVQVQPVPLEEGTAAPQESKD